jgi:hypothetical protein
VTRSRTRPGPAHDGAETAHGKRATRRRFAVAACVVGLLGITAGVASAQRGGGGGGGGSAPTVTITPGTGTFTSPTVTVQIKWCSAQPFNDATRSIKLDGVDVSSSFTTYGTGLTGCVYGATSDGSIVLSPTNDGVHVFIASIEDVNSFMGSSSKVYTFLGVPHATVTAGGSSALYTSQAGSTGFTITSDGTATANVTPSLTACGGAIGGCSVSPAGTVALGVGQSLGVTVSYTAGLAPGTGTATLSAVNASTGASFGSASASVPVSYPPISISATPSPGSLDLFVGDHRTVTYTVLNSGSYPAYVAVSQKQCNDGSCGAIQNGLAYPLSPGQQGSVSFDYGATTPGSGGIALSFVNAQGGNELTAPVVPVTVHALVAAATLTPPSSSVIVPSGQSGNWAFQLTNTGNVTSTMLLTVAECSGGLVSTSCTRTPTSVTLVPNATTTINVGYLASALGSASAGYLRLNATDQSTGALLVQGVMSVTVPQPPSGCP